MQNERLELAHELIDRVRNDLDYSRESSDEDIRRLLAKTVFELSEDRHISLSNKVGAVKIAFNSMRRLDVLQPLLDDRSVTEIMVNGAKDIFIERNGHVTQFETKFESEDRLEDVIQSVVSAADRTVNESNPIVDARLKDGSRVNVVLKPIALNGPIMTIRKFSTEPFTLEQMTKLETLTKDAADFLRLMVKAKYNIFICGGTGCGKTTLLNALSDSIPKDERIVTIEDSAELRITGIKNTVRLETRNSNTEGKGSIPIRELIKTSLRMRPDRIIVGEVRGAEALDMLQAMNTGHDGSLSSGHANSVGDMLARLETMVMMAAPIPAEAIRQQIASAIDIVIFMSRMRDKSRKILEICEIRGCRNGEIIVAPLFVFKEAPEDKITPISFESIADERVSGSLIRTGEALQKTTKLKLAGLEGALNAL